MVAGRILLVLGCAVALVACFGDDDEELPGIDGPAQVELDEDGNPAGSDREPGG